jgi:PiT family inorganic phosphate transporter
MNALLIEVIILALLFDFTNGFHDTANAIATSVATRAVPPKVAVIGAALLNFLGAFVSLKVAATVATGIITPHTITLPVVLAGIIAATTWNLITWRFGLPTSSSHALIGGLAGSAAITAGWSVIQWHGLRDKVLVPSLIAPVLGFVGALVIMTLLYQAFLKSRQTEVSTIFKRLQLLSGSFVAFTHGTNDAQKTMGIIALALAAGHANQAFHVPLWVVVASATAMAAGTYIGGWRIIDTLGHRLVKLEPQQGFAAEATTASILWSAAHFGFPVSTTHTISGSIIGAGVANGQSKVRWKVTRDIFVAWLITLPCAAALGALLQLLMLLPGGSIIATMTGLTVAAIILLTRHWTWESTAQIRAYLNLIQHIRNRASKHPTN